MIDHSHIHNSDLENDSKAENPNGGLSNNTKLILSILAGAVIIAGSIVFTAQMAGNKLESYLKNNQAAAISQTQPVAQTQPTTATQPTATTPTTPVNIVLKAGTPYLGNPNAKVTVVEFADYQCPFCEEFYQTVWPTLKTKYVDTGEIKFVYQDFAFLGPDSITAAEAAHCAEDQNKFWQYHDYLFSHQGEEGSGWATASHQEQFAQSLGLNTTQFNQCLTSNKYQQEVTDETNAGKSYGVTGTPSIFVNGSIIVGAQPLASFEQAIDQALKQ